jgi:iron complex outermembrane receptor protein
MTDALAFDATLHYVDGLPGFTLPSYWQFDARFGWRVIDGMTLELVGQNLFDESHREFGNTTDADATEVPRSFYGRLTWRS